MSKTSYLLGEVEFRLDEIKALNQYFENVLTYDANKKLVPKKDENGNEIKKLKLQYSVTFSFNFFISYLTLQLLSFLI